MIDVEELLKETISQMNEAQTKVLTRLEQEFSDYDIYDPKPFPFTIKIFEQIRNILNAELFNGVLDPILMYFMSGAQLNSKYGLNEPDEFYAKYIPPMKIVMNGVEDKSKYLVGSRKFMEAGPEIVINTKFIGQMSFLFGVNSLCHEMIHQADFECGTLLDIMVAKLNGVGIELDSHATETFKLAFKDCRKKGLDIMINGMNRSIWDLNDAASGYSSIFKESSQLDEVDQLGPTVTKEVIEKAVKNSKKRTSITPEEIWKICCCN